MGRVVNPPGLGRRAVGKDDRKKIPSIPPRDRVKRDY
jgi:hypothetical protein